MTAPESSAVHPPLSKLAVIGVGAAAGLVPLNSTMIAVALPSLAEDLDISVGRASILITVYLQFIGGLMKKFIVSQVCLLRMWDR